MPEIIKKAIGIFTGMILYPLKSLLISAILLMLMGIGVLGALITTLALAFYGTFFSNMRLTAILGGIAVTFGVLIFALVSSVFLLFNTATNVLSQFGKGIREGYTHGLFHILTEVFTTANFSSFHDFWAFVSEVQGNTQPNPEEPYNVNNLVVQMLRQLGQLGLPITVNVNVNVSNIERYPEVNQEFSPLSESQITEAKGIKDLHSLLEKYNDLFNRLNALDTALSQKLVPVDEVIPYTDMTEPCLIFQEYQTGTQWQVIPGSTKITDKSSFERWIKNHNTHPLDRTSITNPPPYNNAPTRYTLMSYRSMNDSLELIQGANFIRDKLSKHLSEELAYNNETSYQM